MSDTTTLVRKPRSVAQVLITKRGKELLEIHGDTDLMAAHYNFEVNGIPLPQALVAETTPAKPTKAERKAAKKARKAAEAAEVVAEPVAAEPEPEPAPALDPVAALVAAGFTEEAARAALKQPAPVAPKGPSIEDQVNDLLTKRGFTWARGRVYVTSAVIEASVRVMRGGSPEVVASSGNGRTVAVAIFKTEAGDVALQNLIRAES